MNKLSEEFGEKATRISMWMDSDNPPSYDELLAAHVDLFEGHKVQLIAEALQYLERTLWKRLGNT